jgi:UDP-N-acetylmuramoylalanine--D-glutamate ligase
MTPVATFAGRSVALFGLGGSGLATALALQAGGASVVACDDDPARLAKAREQGIGTGDLREADWSRFAAFVLSPGVPLTHPAPHWTVGLAQAAGVEIIGDIELFCRERRRLAPESSFVAITGTNGKSTTTALVAHVLRHAGLDVQVGGNIGTAILSLAPPDQSRVHVIEMSSFQIDLTPSLDPTVGLLLNITPDHLDRHGTLANYARVKERLVAGALISIIGTEDRPCREIASRRDLSIGRIIRISDEPVGGETVRIDGTRLAALIAGEEHVSDIAGIASLRGAHNAQNAAAAVAVAHVLDVSDEVIAAGLASFPGLQHRMEEVGRRGDAIFVNDSKATNADSADKALSSFERVFWILGGKPKEGGISVLRHHFGRVEKAISSARPPTGSRPCSTARSRTPARRRSTAPSRRPPPTRRDPMRRSPSCSYRRPAPPMTNSRISRFGAIVFASSCALFRVWRCAHETRCLNQA